MAQRQTDDRDEFLKRYLEERQSTVSDNTRVRFTETQKLKEKNRSGNFNKAEAAVAKSEAASASKRIQNEELRREREERKKKAQEEYNKAAERRRKREKEYWSHEQTDEEKESNEDLKKQRQQEQVEADAQYEAAFQKWKEQRGAVDNETGLRLAFWLKNRIGDEFFGGTDAHISELNGKIADTDIDIQTAKAHSQMIALQNFKKTKQDEYVEYLGKLQDKQSSGQKITQEDTDYLDFITKQLQDTEAQINNQDLQQLDKMYKYNWARKRNLVGGIGTDIWDAVSTTAITATQQQQGVAQRRQKRIEEGVAAYDNNYEHYLDTEYDLDQQNPIASKAFKYNTTTGKIEVSSQQQQNGQFGQLGTPHLNKTKVQLENDAVNNYITDKENLKKKYREGIINTSNLQQEVDKVFKVADEYKRMKQAYQDDNLFSLGYWAYGSSGMIGSSNSSPSQLAANALQTAGMFLGPEGYLATSLASAPLQVQGGLDENYAEIGDKRIDNIKSILDQDQNKKVKDAVMADLAIQSKRYWQAQGMNQEWIKEHTEGQNAEQNLLRDLTSGAISNNNPLMKEAMLVSTKGLRAQRQADNMRTMWETGVQLGLQTPLSMIPLGNVLEKSAGYVRKGIKNRLAVSAAKDADGKIIASGAGSTLRSRLAGESKFANGFSKNTVTESFGKGFEAGSEIAESIGLGGAGSVVGGVIGGAARSTAHMARKINPKFGTWADNVEETLMRKYQNIIDKLTPENEWAKLASRYGLRAIPRGVGQAMSEGSEEGVQYLNSVKDFASQYGYDGMDFGEIIANDMEQGGRVAKAYMSLIGLANSELKDDQEFWNNVKGGFAMGAHNPGIAQLGTMYTSINDAIKEVRASRAIIGSGVVSREADRLNRAANSTFAKETMAGRAQQVVQELERLKEADKRREDPRFSQEDYDEKIEAAKAIAALTNNSETRKRLEKQGIQYGTDRYATAIADIYNVHESIKANEEEMISNIEKRHQLYNSKEFTDAVDKAVENLISYEIQSDPELHRKQAEARNKAIKDVQVQAAQNGEDINTAEFKEHEEQLGKQAEDKVIEDMRAQYRRNVISNVQLLSEGRALLKLRAQSNSIENVFDFIAIRTGLKTKRPDAKIVNDVIEARIKNLKEKIHAQNKNFDVNSTEQQLLDYINNVATDLDINFDQFEDLELANTMISADAAINKKYSNQIFSSKEGLYGRRVDAIMEANARNQKLNWFVNDVYSGDAVNKLNDVLDEEARKEFAELQKKAKTEKESKTTESPLDINKHSTKSKLEANKKKANERIAKAKERYQRRRKKLHRGRLHSEVIPVTAFASMANDLMYLAEKGAYKFTQFVSDVKDIIEDNLDNQSLENAKEAYIKKATKFKFKHPDLADNVSNINEIREYTESVTVDRKPYIAAEIRQVPAGEFIQKLLEQNQENVDTELSTYYDTIVTENGVTTIYPNVAEIELRRLANKDGHWKSISEELRRANTSKESFEAKLKELQLPLAYSKYREVEGIYDAVARAREQLLNQNNSFLVEAIRMRKLAVACFLDDQATIDSYGEEYTPIIEKLKKMAANTKAAGLYVISANQNIHGIDNNGKKISSEVDLLLADRKGNIHVIDILTSYAEIHKRWNRKPGDFVPYTIGERENDILHQLQHLLTNNGLNIVGLSVIPIVSDNNIKFIEDRIKIKLDTKDDDVEILENNESVQNLNDKIDQYNSLEDQCKIYDIPFQKIDKFVQPTTVTDAEKQSLANRVESMSDEVQMRISEVNEQIIQAIEEQKYIFETQQKEFEDQHPETDSIILLSRLNDTCRNLDILLDTVPNASVATETQKQLLNQFIVAVHEAQDALNDVLSNPETSKTNVRQEEELIASAMEKLVKNRQYYGEQAVEVGKWWLTRFTLLSSNKENNTTESAPGMQMILNRYYDTINSWINTLKEHILSDLDDDVVLQRWYSTLLNNYFTKLLGNAQTLVAYLKEHGINDSTVDVNLPDAVQEIINLGNDLLKEFNDSYGVDPDEIYDTPAENEIEEVNRMPITWNSPIGKSKSYAPAFDKMKGGEHMEPKRRNWAMIYQKMSTKPDFLEKAEFQFYEDGDDVKVFIKYEGLSCYLPFITDLNSYPEGSLTPEQIHEIKLTNRAKKKFVAKIKALLRTQKSNPNYVISVTKSLNKGSLIYPKKGEPRVLNNVSSFLFTRENSKDLYTIQISADDEIGFLVKKDIDTPRESWGVWCGDNLNYPIRSFDREYIKGNTRFYNGAMLFNFNTGNGQKIPALIDRAAFSSIEAKQLVDLIKMYMAGQDYVQGYPIIDLLNMRLYLSDPSVIKSQFNNCGNRITIDRVTKQVIIGNEPPYNTADRYNQLIQRIQQMPNMIDNSLLNESLALSQNPIFSQVRSNFANDTNLQSVTLPNGFVINRDDVTHQNEDGSRGSTWLGYLFRHNVLGTTVTGMSYKQINFGDPKLVEKEKVDSDEKIREQVAKQEEISKKPISASDLINLFAAKMDRKGSLNMTVDSSELVERTDEEVSEFRKTVEEYFDQVFGNHDDVTVEGHIQSSLIPGRVAAGVCADSYAQMATNAPESVMFHEAFHKVLELVLPASQREYFYSTYRAKFGKDNSDRDVAEGLCDLFTDYMEHKMAHKRAKGFGKIYTWFKKVAFNIALFYKLGPVNNRKFHQFYNNINKGVYKNQKISQENIDRFNKVFNNGAGRGLLFYTVEDPNKENSKVDFQNITNSAELQDLVKSIGFMIARAHNLEQIGSDPSKVKVNENTPKQIFKWLDDIAFSVGQLGRMHPALEEVFEESERETVKNGNTVKQKYYPKFEAIQQLVSDYLETILGEYDGKFKDLPENEDEDETAQKANIDKFDRASYEFSKLDSTTAKVKFFFSTIPYMNQDGTYDTSRNSMNFFHFMPLEEVYNIIVNDMHEASSLSDLLCRMERSQNKSAMHKMVYEKFRELTDGMYQYDETGKVVNVDYDKEAFAIQILSLIRSQKIDFIVALSETTENGKNVRIASSSLERDSRQYPQQWMSFLTSGQIPIFSTIRDKEGNLTINEGKEEVFRNTATFFRDLQESLKYNKSFDLNGVSYDPNNPSDFRALKSEIIKKLYEVGIIFPIQAFEHMLRQKYSTSEYSGDSIEGLRSWLEQREKTSINTFLQTIEGFVNKSGKVDQNAVKVGYSNIGFVKDLGNWMGEYNRITTQQMALGLNGKKLYSISQNNSISHIINALNTLDRDNDVIKTLMQFGYNLSDTEGIFGGSIMLKQILNRKKPAHFKLHTYIGIKTDHKEDKGSEYSKEAIIDDYIAKMTMLQSGIMVFPTLADKGTWVCIDGVDIPGMILSRTSKKDNDGNATGWITDVKNPPTVVHVNGEWILRPSDAVLNQMIEYTKGERLAIQQCMEDLGYDNISGYIKQGRKQLSDKSKIKNYHTDNKNIYRNGKKVKGEKVEPNGTRFLALTQIVINNNGKFETINLNDPNKSSKELLELANKHFFNKPIEEQREIMAYTLDVQRKQSIAKAEKMGLIERKEVSTLEGGKPKVIYSAEDKSTSLNLDSKHLNQDQINAIANVFMNQRGWDKEQNPYIKKTLEEMCKSLAISAILQDVTNRSIISSEEVKRCFSGHPALFKVDYDKGKGIIKDSTYDIQKRIGGMISTGDDNVTDLHEMPEIYTCAECKDYEVSSTASVASRLDKMFEDSAVREIIAIYTNNWDITYKKPVDELVKSIEEMSEDILFDEYVSPDNVSQDEWDRIVDNFSKDDLLEAIRKAKERAAEFSSAYKDGINVADGASYITDKMCENMLRMRGAYGNEVKRAFEILRDTNSRYSWTQQADAYKTVYDAVKIVATKYTAYGFRPHTLNGEQVSDISVAYYNKFALFPVFPCLATGPMGHIYQKMLDEKVDMLFMDSAVKVGSQCPIEFDGKTFNAPFNTYTQNFAYLRRQLNTDPEEGSTIAIGTQMVKIGLQNLRLDRTYTHNATGENVSGSELLAEFMGHIKRISELGVSKINDKFFVDGDPSKGVDPIKLSKYLKEQLGSRNVNKNVINAIDLTVENGQIKLKAPLSATTDAQWIESILISTINKEVIDINTPGSSFVQRSVFAIEAEDGEGQIQGADFYNGQKLEMINEDGSMDAVISIDYFDNILPEGLSFTEKRQWLIDNNIIGPNAKANTIGYRIPTQAQSSIHALRFIDVLPATQAAVILPREFTKITGSDFDIDHLYLASYNYATDKQTVSFGGTENIDIITASHIEGLTELQQEQNGLIDCMMTLLKDTENSINSLYKSIDNDTQIPKALADQIEPAESEKHLPFNFGALHEQVERKNDYITGKTGIGPFALNVTNQILTYLYGVSFKKTYFTENTPIGHLHHLIDYNDDYISSWLSAFINAHVDIVKDPWISKLNVNPFTYNLINLFVRCGVGEAGVWLLCQPVMKDLALASDKAKSEYSREAGVSKSKYRKQLTEEVLDQYGIIHDDATVAKYTTSQQVKDIKERSWLVSDILENVEALRAIALNPKATTVTLSDGSIINVREYQQKVFYAFKSVEKYSIALSNLVQHTKIDTRKHGKSLIQQAKYLDAYDKLFNPKDTSMSLWDLDSLKRLANNSWIEQKTRNAIALPKMILSGQTYNANEQFMSIVISFANRLSSTEDDALSEDTIALISRHLQTAIKAEYMVDYAKQVLGRSEQYISKLFLGDKNGNRSLARRLNGLKYSVETMPEYERLKGNYLIEKIRPQNETDPVSTNDGKVARQPQFITIDSNVDGSKTNENMMIDAWEDLLNDPDESVRAFAEDLILYTFFTTGENKGWNKLFKYVPFSWIEQQHTTTDGRQFPSFSQYVESTLDGNMPNLESMLDNVVANNFMDYHVCKQMKRKDENGNPNFMSADIDGPVVVAKAVDANKIDREAPAYISIKKTYAQGSRPNAYNVYKLVGELPSPVKGKIYPVYALIQKRGYSSGGNDVFEYGFNLGYTENETKRPNTSFEEAYNRIAEETAKGSGKPVQNWSAVDSYLAKVYAGEQPDEVHEEEIKKTHVKEQVTTNSLVITGNASTTAQKSKEINGVDTLRHPDTNGMHFGNPFSHTNYKGVQKVMPSVKNAVIAFEEWLRGRKYQDIEPERRQWILDQINSGKLDNKPLVYYTNKVPDNSYGRTTYDYNEAPNHAHILQKLINEHRNQSILVNENPSEYTLQPAMQGGTGYAGEQPDVVSKEDIVKSKTPNYYEGNITPDVDTIFVFGSNPEGRHEAGAAKIARMQFGAQYGVGEGLTGNAYALPTKDLRVKENNSLKSISPENIIKSIQKLYENAKQHPNKQFKVAYRNTTQTSLNGYTGLEMIQMFIDAGEIPSNIVFSKEWVDTGVFDQFTPSEEELAADREFHNMIDTSLDAEIEIKDSVKYYHKPFITSTGKKLKYSAFMKFVNNLININYDDLPKGTYDLKVKQSSSKPMQYSIPYRNIKEFDDMFYVAFKDFINDIMFYTRGDGFQYEENDHPIAFVYNKQTRSYETSSREIYGAVMALMYYPALEEFLDDHNIDLTDYDGNIEDLGSDLREMLETGKIKSETVIVNDAQQELFPEMSLAKSMEQDVNYEVFSQEELNEAKKIKKYCKGE